MPDRVKPRLSRRAVCQLAAGNMGVAILPDAAWAASASSVSIARVRVEWQDEPLGIDTRRPRFQWTLKARDPRARGLRQSALRLTISDGTGRAIYDSGRQASMRLSYTVGADVPLQSQNRYAYRLEISDQDGRAATHDGHFSTGLMNAADRRGRWIAAEREGRHVIAASSGGPPPVDNPKPMPEFTRAFQVAAQPVAAHLCIAGLGQYQLYLDGRKISPDGLNGQWTNYDRRVDYDCYDLAAALKAGGHELKVALGNGFFNVEAGAGRYVKLNGGFGQPQMWLQLRLLYADGREEFLVSDESWKAGYGPVRFSSIYGGEDYDARITAEMAGAMVIDGPSGRLSVATFRPMQVQKRLTPIKVTTPKPGAQLFDFGLNHSGRPDIRLTNTKPGQIVTLYPSEILSADGTFDQKTMAGGRQPFYKGIKFTYICRGGPEERWQPQFTYTGYRYLQVEGLDQAKIDLASLFLYDAVDSAGTFDSTDRNLVAIHALIRQAFLSNLASVMTDCPHREKLGWLEQAYLNARTAMMNMDVVRVYEKMMADVRDTQAPTGQVPSTAPEYVRFITADGKDEIWRDSAEWGASLIMSSWYVYQLYGDPRILSDNFAAMRARMAYMETRLNERGLIDYGMGDWDDYTLGKLGPSQLTSKAMTGTATFYMELVTLAQAAAQLGADGSAFARRAGALKATLQKELYNADTGQFDTGSQTAQAMAVVLDLAPEAHRQKVLDLLIADIHAHNDHVTAGDIGFHYVVRALSDTGHHELMHTLLSRTDAPSYLDQIAKGATALTEAWDSRSGSHNHFMMGHAEIWLWSGLGGITIDHSREDVLVIAPQPVAGVEATEVQYQSVFGPVTGGLSKRGKTLTVTAEVPPGTTAVVKVPGAAPLREGGRSLDRTPGVLSVAVADGATVIHVGSGRYRFATTV